MKKIHLAIVPLCLFLSGLGLIKGYTKNTGISQQIMENVEALTSDEMEEPEDPKFPTPTGYFVFHMPQFNKWGDTTGLCYSHCTAFYEGTGNSSECHSHGPSSCCH